MSARSILASLAATALAACQSPQPPLATMSHVDLDRFMGAWFVIASIPTFIEANAYNAVESYRLDADGSIATTFTFNEGALNGPVKRYTPRGFVIDKSSNAVWGMRFVWPIKADYRIIHLDTEYSQTVIAREARDYVWIMARSPDITDADYARLVQVARDAGYDTTKLRKVPHMSTGQSHARAR